MIVIKLSSGLGNQLFMYSFYKYIENKYGIKPFFDDKAFLNDMSGRRSEISILFPNYPKISFNFNPIGEHGVKKYLYKLKQILFPSFKFVTEEEYDDNIIYSDDVYFNGYWQTDRYVSQINRLLFEPKEEKPLFVKNIEKEIKNVSCPVAIHFRRGDYFSPKYINRYGVCTADYYKKAMCKLQSIVTQDITFFVFSDDLDWVKNNIKFNCNYLFIPNEAINSFWYIFLMSKCHHSIISNSTFSWWGAYLNENKNKVVIGPDKWMFDSNNNIMLKEWIRIKI